MKLHLDKAAFEFIQQRKELEISNSLILCKYFEKP